MIRAYHEIDFQRSYIHDDSAITEASGPETEEQQNERMRKNLKIFRKIMFNEVQLSANMVAHFYPFMELPPNQRVCINSCCRSCCIVSVSTFVHSACKFFSDATVQTVLAAFFKN